MNIITATIYKANPLTGVHQILPDTGVDKLIHAIPLSIAGNISIQGVNDIVTYNIGDRVVAVIDPKDTEGYSVLEVGLILGSMKVSPIDADNKQYDILNQFFTNQEAKLTAEQDVTKEDPDSDMRSNFSYGRPIDVLPGEFSRLNHLNGGIFFNEFMSFIGAGDRSKIETFLFDNTLRITADILEHRQLTNEDWVYTDDGLSVHVKQIAKNIKEAVGLLNDEDELFPEEEGDYPGLEVKEKPFMNQQTFEGGLIEGKVSQHRIHPKEEESLGASVLSINEDSSGHYDIKAAGSITIAKTLNIPVINMLVDQVRKIQSKDTHEDHTPEDEQEDDLRNLFGKLGLDLSFDSNLSNRFKKIRERTKDWSISETKDEIIKTLKDLGISIEEPELEKLGQKAEYPKEPYLDVGDLSKQDIKKLTALSSIIKLHDDGSVTIAGGYGEELTMNRGNITITCPGDIYRRPGRSNIDLAGKHNIIHSATGQIEMEGTSINGYADDVQLIAGINDKGGSFLIENKSTKTAYFNDDEEELNINNGGITFKGKELFMINESVKVQAMNGQPGSFSVFSERFNVYSKYTEIQSLGNGAFKMTIADGGSGTGIIITPKIMEMLSKDLRIGTDSLFMKATKGIHKVNINDEETMEVNCGGSSSEVTMRLDGKLTASDLALLGSVNEEIDPKSYSKIMQDDKPESWPGGIPITSLDKPITKMNMNLAKFYDNPLMSYPKSYQQEIKLATSYWQTKLQESGAGEYWPKPIEIKARTSFPGIEARKEAIYNTDLEKKPMEGYIINS